LKKGYPEMKMSKPQLDQVYEYNKAMQRKQLMMKGGCDWEFEEHPEEYVGDEGEKRKRAFINVNNKIYQWEVDDKFPEGNPKLVHPIDWVEREWKKKRREANRKAEEDYRPQVLSAIKADRDAWARRHSDVMVISDDDDEFEPYHLWVDRS
jgi:hypothetical protein